MKGGGGCWGVAPGAGWGVPDGGLCIMRHRRGGAAPARRIILPVQIMEHFLIVFITREYSSLSPAVRRDMIKKFLSCATILLRQLVSFPHPLTHDVHLRVVHQELVIEQTKARTPEHFTTERSL